MITVAIAGNTKIGVGSPEPKRCALSGPDTVKVFKVTREGQVYTELVRAPELDETPSGTSRHVA